ncbi:BQ5605_C004g02640 [Microbotryum silenes-dioicae]|uniref:BQ5605_C004g02640 protein n=1 Tax=Microbotryum silenes-dioicae TaxID=796604 RepID=A0A2X0M8B6_9BASI|nr:BQ5605_C004g02640 [Microbotryum silenes-dioicae]
MDSECGGMNEIRDPGTVGRTSDLALGRNKRPFETHYQLPQGFLESVSILELEVIHYD